MGGELELIQLLLVNLLANDVLSYLVLLMLLGVLVLLTNVKWVRMWSMGIYFRAFLFFSSFCEQVGCSY